MRRWPWYTTLVALVLGVSRFGREFIAGAFFSNEALTRNIALPIVSFVLLALVGCGLLEVWLRWDERRG